jgi:O-succinylbenzoic acid--CoA ligase
VRVGLLDATLEGAALERRLRKLEPDLLICEDETAATAANADHPAVTLDPPTSHGLEQFDAFEPSRGTAADSDWTASPLGELVAFTSGTTGEPKAVRLPLETLVASAVASALRLGVASNDRWLVPIPTYHVGGFSPFLRCAQAGTTVVLQREYDAGRTIDAIDQFDVTCVSLVPTQLSRMLDAGWHGPDSLRFALVGGGPVRENLLDRCRERDVPICPTYGTTETASQVATARTETAFDNPGTVGRPLAFANVSIVDDGTQQPPGETGEIVVDGPLVTPGYVDAGNADESFDERGFHTGDLGRVDDEGRLWIEGRMDDRIVTGGENVQAGTVADAIRTLEGVVDVAVVGIDDDEWGERVGALVVADADLSVEDLRDHCRGHVPPYAVPKTVAFADALPHTPSGTVDRAAVERELR